MTCFSYRVAAKFDHVICKYICVVSILETQLTTFLTSTWPELACSLSAHPWLVSCTVSVPWAALLEHTQTPLCTVLSFTLLSSRDWATLKKRKNKKIECELWLQAQAKQYRDQSYKEECRGTVWQNPPYLPTYPPTHPPQERFSVSAGATQSGRDSKYSTV